MVEERERERKRARDEANKHLSLIFLSSGRYLYWTDWSSGTPRIVKNSMDGQNQIVLANSSKVTWPNALALDYTNEVLYWADANRDVIGRMNTDGTDYRIIANISSLPSPVTVTPGLCLTSMGTFTGVTGLTRSPCTG